MEGKTENSTAFKQPRLWLSAFLCSLLLAVEIYALVYDLDSQRGSGQQRPVIAKLKQGVNEVRRKEAGTIAWHTPTAGDDLRRSDTILTLSGAQAVVSFNDGAELGIEPDSLVVLEKAEKVVINLIQGSLSKRASGSQPMSVVAGDTRVEDVDGRAVFRLRATATGVKIEVERGAVKLDDGRMVGPSERATIGKDGRIDVREVALQFSALEPAPNRSLVRDRPDDEVAVSWTQILGKQAGEVRPHVLVSSAPDMSDAEEAEIEDAGAGDAGANSRKMRAKFKPKADGRYYWRLESPEDDEKTRAQTEATPFLVITRAPPAPLTPDDDAAVAKDAPVTFRWKREGLAAKIVLLETSETEDFARPRTVASRPGESEISIRPDRTQTLYWRLRADYGSEIGSSPPGEVRKLEVKPKELLNAPKIKKARVRLNSRLEPRPVPPRLLRWIAGAWSLFMPDAAAAAPPLEPGTVRKVTVELEWDAVDGAREYHLQIAEDEAFTKLMLDRKVPKTTFIFKSLQTTKDQTFYYRISSIDASGDEGPFSDNQEVEIEKMPRSRTPKKPPTQGDKRELTPEELRKKYPWILDVSIGAAYHRRTFKNTLSPKSSIGGAMIPAYGTIEFRKWLGEGEPDAELRGHSYDDKAPRPMPYTIDIGVSLIAEKAEPTTPNVIVEKYPVPLLRLWAMLESTLWERRFGLGAYATTSQKFTWNGRRAANQRLLLLGISAALGSAPLEKRNWHWRAHLGIVGVGALGADFNGTIRHSLWSNESVRAMTYSGFYMEAEGFGRFVTSETSFGAAFKIGYSF